MIDLRTTTAPTFPIVPTTAPTLNTDHDTPAAATATTSVDEATALSADVVNDQDERTHWHPAAPGVPAAVPAARLAWCGGGGC